MKVSMENDNNFGYEKITIVVDNMPLKKKNKTKMIQTFWTRYVKLDQMKKFYLIFCTKYSKKKQKKHFQNLYLLYIVETNDH